MDLIEVQPGWAAELTEARGHRGVPRCRSADIACYRSL
jgi:hypothetical protein